MAMKKESERVNEKRSPPHVKFFISTARLAFTSKIRVFGSFGYGFWALFGGPKL
jgi:hypothetical protein